MMGGYFYNKHVRNAVAVFGSLFDNIHVLRTKSDGDVLSQVKVPLSYAPKRDFIERLEQMSNGEEAERRVAVKLPRASFEIVSMFYDAQRQLPKMNRFSLIDSQNNKTSLYTGTPYTISFQLNIYAKTQDDALQIVEQIIPYFAPQYTVSIKPFADHPDHIEDVPLVLTGINFQDDFEGPIEQRRTIIYTLDFEMKINLYAQQYERPIIREVNTDLFSLNEDSDSFLSNINITPDPIDVSPDSDFGFNIEITDDRF